MEDVGGIYKCLYDFNAETECDLQLKKGEIVKITKQVNTEWLEGYNQQNLFGQFPANFVQLVLKHPEVDHVGIVINNFTAEQQQDLPLIKDDIIGIEKNIDSNWFQGFDSSGKHGIFPASFIREILFSNAPITNHHGYDSNNNETGSPTTNFKVSPVTTSSKPPMAKVIDAFQAQEPDELTLNIGDEVTLTREIDSFWIEGTLNDNKGKFPKMYVDIILDLPSHLKYKEEGSKEKQKESALPIPSARALFMFVGTDADDLSFDKGDTIQLTRRINKEWLVGKIGNTVGKFPANYVDIMIDLPFTANNIISTSISPANSATSNTKASATMNDVVATTTTNAVKKNRPNTQSSFRNKPSSPSNSRNNIAPSRQSSFKSKALCMQSDSKIRNVPTTTTATPNPQRQPMKTKVVANNIPSAVPLKRVLSNPGSSHSTNATPISPPPINTTTLPNAVHSPQKVNDDIIRRKSLMQCPKEELLKKPNSGEKPREKPIAKYDSNSNGKPSLREKPINIISKSPQKETKKLPLDTTSNEKSRTAAVSPSKERKFSVGKKKPPPSRPKPHRFELVEEKIFDMYSNPTLSNTKSNTLTRKTSLDKRPVPPPSLPNHNNLSPMKSSSLSNKPKLPKPLAPMPALQRKERPLSLNLQQQYSSHGNRHQRESSPISPISIVNSDSSSVVFKKQQQDSTTNIQYNIPSSSLSSSSSWSRNETEPSQRPTNINHQQYITNNNKIINQQKPTVNHFQQQRPVVGQQQQQQRPVMGRQQQQQRPILGQQQQQQRPVVGRQQQQRPVVGQQLHQRPKSLYFASTSPPSSEKRSLTLDAVLQRSSSLRLASNLELPRKTSATLPITPGIFDSFSQNSTELKRIDTEMAELKSKIEAEAHLLSGVETLLDFVSEDKKADLITKQDQHNANIVEMNDDLNALEDQKSYLLASLGKVDDVLHRVTELEKQIEMYLDNCEQLRRMQDVAVVEELPEIRDSIEFCENMVDTLQDELNGLREKLGEMGELDEEEGDTVDVEEMLAKKKKNQMNVIEELMNTERTYNNHINQLHDTMKDIENIQEKVDIDTEVLFGNLGDIVELSSKLLRHFDSINIEENNEVILKKISSAFVNLSTEMKDCYASYCRNYDDAQMLKEKYEEDPATWNHIVNSINKTSSSSEGFNLGSYLIKPVQRVLKYPLLLSELYKNEVDGCASKVDLKIALDTVTDVATAINEFKRRKDLVLKYRETEEGIGKRVQKLNWHSVAKKSSRINQKITQFTGLNSQTVDDNFIEEEKRFRALEKLIKIVLKNIQQFVEEFKENSVFQKQCAESLHQMLEGEEAHEEVLNYYNKISQITELYTDQMLTFIKGNVTDPLTQLLQLFPAPFRLIQKRNDKCLDYDRAKNKAQKVTDSKEGDKINQMEKELQMCESVYTALNAQLLEELPCLSEKCSSFLIYCLQNFTEARKRYFSKAFSELETLWKLPFIKKDCDLYELHRELISKASDQLTNLTFVPSGSNKELNRRNQPTSSEQTLSNGKTNFFLDLNNSTKSPTSQPLIDLNDVEINTPPDDDIEGVDLLTLSSTSDFPPIEFSNDDVLVPEKLSDVDVIHPSTTETSNKDDSASVFPRHIVKYDFHAEHSSELSVLEGVLINVLRKCDTSGNSEWWLVEYGGNKGYMPQSFLEECPKPTSSLALHSNTTAEMPNSEFYDENSTRYNLLPNTITLSNRNNNNDQSVVANSKFYSESTNDKNVDIVETQSRISIESDTLSYSTGDSHSEKSVSVSVTAADSNGDDDCFVLEYDFEALNAGELSAKEGQVVKCLYKHDQKGNTEWWYVECDGQRGYIPRDYLSFCDKTQMC